MAAVLLQLRHTPKHCIHIWGKRLNEEYFALSCWGNNSICIFLTLLHLSETCPISSTFSKVLWYSIPFEFQVWRDLPPIPSPIPFLEICPTLDASSPKSIQCEADQFPHINGSSHSTKAFLKCKIKCVKVTLPTLPGGWTMDRQLQHFSMPARFG